MGTTKTKKRKPLRANEGKRARQSIEARLDAAFIAERRPAKRSNSKAALEAIALKVLWAGAVALPYARKDVCAAVIVWTDGKHYSLVTDPVQSAPGLRDAMLDAVQHIDRASKRLATGKPITCSWCANVAVVHHDTGKSKRLKHACEAHEHLL